MGAAPRSMWGPPPWRREAADRPADLSPLADRRGSRPAQLGRDGDSDLLRTRHLDHHSSLSQIESGMPDRGFDRPGRHCRTRPEPRRGRTRPHGMPIPSATWARLGGPLTGRLMCWRSLAVPVVQTALAAGLSWFVAVHLFGHRAPLFAPVAAIVCTDMTLGQRLRRAIELILGASVGLG